METNYTETQITKEVVLNAIRSWLDLRTAANSDDEVVGFFNDAKAFIITRDFYTIWADLNPDYLHAYPSVIDNELNFILVDAVTDKKIKDSGEVTEADLEKIKIAPFSMELTDKIIKELDKDKDGNITKQKAKDRMDKWKKDKNTWIPNKLNESRANAETGIFKIFSVPFGDLQSNFDGNNDPVETLLVMGINDDTGKEEGDMLVWGYNTAGDTETLMTTPSVESESVDDTVIVCPPFCNGGVGGDSMGLMALATE